MKTHQRTSHEGRLTLSNRGVALLLAAAATLACGGVSDVKTKHTEGTAGSSGAAGAPDTADTAGTAGTAGADATAGSSSGGTNADRVCDPGERRCDGDTPEVCKADAWIPEEPCDAATQACSGAGVCAAFRLVDAGIGTFGQRPAEPVAGAKLILKSQTLSAAPRACSTKLCITGDLR